MTHISYKMTKFTQSRVKQGRFEHETVFKLRDEIQKYFCTVSARNIILLSTHTDQSKTLV